MSLRFSKGSRQSCNQFIPLIPKLRHLTGSSITDEALLTFLLKSDGDVERAAEVCLKTHFAQNKTQRYKLLSPWSSLEGLEADEKSSRQSNLNQKKGSSAKMVATLHEAPVTGDVSPVQPPTTEGPKNHLRNASSDKKTHLFTSSSHSQATISNTHVEETIMSGTSRNTFSSNSVGQGDNFYLGTFETDITSSCRLQIKTLDATEPEITIHLQFQIVSTKQHLQKKGKRIHKPNNSLDSGKDNQVIRAQASLDTRHLGVASQKLASVLGPLIQNDFVRITSNLSFHNLPNPINIGSSIPINLCAYITNKALQQTDKNMTTYGESILRGCWTSLFFTYLKLQPNRPSLFWSGQQEQQHIEASSIVESLPKTPLSEMIHTDEVFIEDAKDTSSKSGYESDVTSLEVIQDDKLHCEHELENGESDNYSNDEDDDDDLSSHTENTDAVKKTNELLGIMHTTMDSDNGKQLNLHPCLFRSQLRPYQYKGVQWMRSKEAANVLEFNDTSTPQDKRILHPMWDEFRISVERPPPTIEEQEPNDFVTFYFNRTTGAISQTFPDSIPHCLGGILADEMGLGKTVQTIALLACELYPSQEELRKFPLWLQTIYPDFTLPKDFDYNDIINNNTLERFTNRSTSTPIDVPIFTDYLIKQRTNVSATKRHMELLTTNESAGDTKLILRGGTLIVLPLSLVPQWQCELSHHLYPGVCTIIEYYGSDRPRDPVTLCKADIVLTTYGTVTSEWSSVCEPKKYRENKELPLPAKSPLTLIHWRRIVLDEAHIIKCHTTKTCKAVCSLTATNLWCLTGTPIQNSVEDLFSYFKFLRIDPWGHWLVVEPLQRNIQALPDIVAVVRNIIHPIILRRTKTMCDSLGNPIITLPPKTEHVVLLTLSEDERRFYDAIFKKVSTEFDELIQSGQIFRNYTHVLELLLRLRQAACHPLLVYSGTSTKVLQSLGSASHWMTKFFGHSFLNNGSAGTKGSEAFLQSQLDDLVKGSIQTTCPICFEPPEDSVLIPCGHILCRACALSALSSSSAIKQHNDSTSTHSHKGYPCPICRKIFSKSMIVAIPGATRVSKRVFDCLIDTRNEFRYSSKLKALAERLQNDMKERVKSVVFSQWTVLLDIIEIMLKHLEIVNRRFDGSLNLQQRKSVITWFSSENTQAAVLLVSLRAGGIGLNLTAATRCYIMDPWWNPAVEDQAIQRIHRIGQSLPKTVEERIIELQKAKEFHAKGVLEGAHINTAAENNKLGMEDLQIMFRGFVHD